MRSERDDSLEEVNGGLQVEQGRGCRRRVKSGAVNVAIFDYCLQAILHTPFCLLVLLSRQNFFVK
jgi:hypothetical protein